MVGSYLQFLNLDDSSSHTDGKLHIGHGIQFCVPLSSNLAGWCRLRRPSSHLVSAPAYTHQPPVFSQAEQSGRVEKRPKETLMRPRHSAKHILTRSVNYEKM